MTGRCDRIARRVGGETVLIFIKRFSRFVFEKIVLQKRSWFSTSSNITFSLTHGWSAFGIPGASAGAYLDAQALGLGCQVLSYPCVGDDARCYHLKPSRNRCSAAEVARLVRWGKREPKHGDPAKEALDSCRDTVRTRGSRLFHVRGRTTGTSA